MMPSLPWKPSGRAAIREVFVSDSVTHDRRPHLRVVSEPVPQIRADLLSRHRRPRPSRHFRLCAADLFVQSDIDEIQRQYAGERIDQGLADVRRVAASPHRRKSKDADEIVDTPLQALDFLDGLFDGGFHEQHHDSKRRGESSLAHLTKELLWRYIEWILLEDAAQR